MSSRLVLKSSWRNEPGWTSKRFQKFRYGDNSQQYVIPRTKKIKTEIGDSSNIPNPLKLPSNLNKNKLANGILHRRPLAGDVPLKKKVTTWPPSQPATLHGRNQIGRGRCKINYNAALQPHRQTMAAESTWKAVGLRWEGIRSDLRH